MVEPQPSKLTMPVRSRSPAPHVFPGESLARPKSPKIHSSVGKSPGTSTRASRCAGDWQTSLLRRPLSRPRLRMSDGHGSLDSGTGGSMATKKISRTLLAYAMHAHDPNAAGDYPAFFDSLHGVAAPLASQRHQPRHPPRQTSHTMHVPSRY